MALVKIWDKEIKGKLWAVGDIHGCYNLLMTRLKEIGFDFENDLLVAVGDLVDRGAQNIECIELLSKPWFTSVRGNHEDLCIGGLHNESYKRCHVANGGEWFYELEYLKQLEIIKKIKNHVSDMLSWVNRQAFPPAVKVVLHTILKGMLFTAGEKGFELLVRVFF